MASACGWSISPGPVPFLPNALMNVPSLENLRIRAFAPPTRVAFGDEDISVRRDEDVVRLPEVLRLAPAPRLAQCHQELPFGAELEDLMSLGGPGRAAVVSPGPPPYTRNRSPRLPLVIDVDPVRRDEHPGTERLHESLPDSSNLRGWLRRSEPSPSGSVLQRSKTQMLLPSLSISTALVEPPRSALRGA